MNIFLDDNNDIVMVDGGLSLVTGLEEIRQLVGQVLRSFQANWFLNLDLGMPYFQTILKKSTTPAQLESIYLDAITRTQGILDVESFRLDFDKATRTVNVIFTAQTSDGVINFNLNGEG